MALQLGPALLPLPPALPPLLPAARVVHVQGVQAGGHLRGPVVGEHAGAQEEQDVGGHAGEHVGGHVGACVGEKVGVQEEGAQEGVAPQVRAQLLAQARPTRVARGAAGRVETGIGVFVSLCVCILY